MTPSSTTENVSDWNYVQQQPNSDYQYPSHMYFDPQYPGWYYDAIVQEWRSLEAYHASIQSADQTLNQQSPGYSLDDRNGQGPERSLATSSTDYGQQGADTQFALLGSSVAYSTMVQSQQSSSEFNIYSNNQGSQMFADSTGALTSNGTTNQSNNNSNWVSGVNKFSQSNNFPPSNHTQQVQQNGPPQYPTTLYTNQHSGGLGQPFFSNGHHVSYPPREGRSFAGRPPHTLVTFGFGGKLAVIKDSRDSFSTLGSKNGDGYFLSVFDLMDVLKLDSGSFSTKASGYSYFSSLCHQSFPGSLVGGNVGSKELYKWIDGRISNYVSLDMNSGYGQGLKLLLSLLKIACQHYGKLRSYGGDTGLKDNDPPESAVAKLFATAKRNDSHYNASTKCLMSIPSEAQLQVVLGNCFRGTKPSDIW